MVFDNPNSQDLILTNIEDLWDLGAIFPITEENMHMQHISCSLPEW